MATNSYGQKLPDVPPAHRNRSNGTTRAAPNPQYAYFKELPITTIFLHNGVLYQKANKDFASAQDGRKFLLYFSSDDLCVVSAYSRLSDDYFKVQPPLPEGTIVCFEDIDTLVWDGARNNNDCE
jgi:hypothetical protein